MTGYQKMHTGSIGPILERTYRASHPLQWVRELVVNSNEADAGQIVFTTEWEAVRELGVHRRLVWDDGCGMSAEEMIQFLNTYGGGGKPIGELHENFGVGFKTSSLPWNKHGIVVISVKDGEESMIVLKYFQEDLNYGAVYFDDLVDEAGNIVQEIVCQPGEYEGIDYSKVVPDHIRELGHGTVTVLLGNTGEEDTILGDPERPIEAQKYWWGYVNERFYDLDKEIEIRIREYANHETKSLWPKKDDQIGGSTTKTLYGQWRTPSGIQSAITNANRFKVSQSGKTPVISEDGITADVIWAIAEGTGLNQNVISQGNMGMVSPSTCAAIYRNELYDFVKTGNAAVGRFNRFGIFHEAVRKQLFLFVEPAEWTDSKNHGAYPDESRSRLLVSPSGNNLPWDEWGADFMEKMPTEIRDLIKKHEPKSSPNVRRRLTRLAEEWHERFKITRFMLDNKGKAKTAPVHTASSKPESGPLPTPTVSTDPEDPIVHSPVPTKTPRKPIRRKTAAKGAEDHSGDAESTTGPGARPLEIRSDLPEVQWVSQSDFSEFDPPTAIAGKYVQEAGPTGTLMLNEDWVVYIEIRNKILHEKSVMYDADDLVIAVKNELATIALSKIAHARVMFDRMSPDGREGLLSAYAITTSLSGFYAEEQIIASAIGGLTKKSRKLAAV